MLRFLRRRAAEDTSTQSKPALLAWWESAFTLEESEHILAKYQPMGFSVASGWSDLLIGNVIREDGTLRLPLTRLATWFMSPPEDLPIARRLLEKGIELGEGTEAHIVDRHFTYYDMIQVYYRDRNRDPEALDLAIAACETQIAVAPEVGRAWFDEYPKDERLPMHPGYRQLAIIREKQKGFAEAIRLSQEAQEQGWDGDWEKRIARCQNRLHRSKAP